MGEARRRKKDGARSPDRPPVTSARIVSRRDCSIRMRA
jgi:hypothetical protein